MSQLTTFNQAKRMRGIGFPYGALQYYNIETGEIDNDVIFYPQNALSAPSVSEALDWIREEKGIECAVEFVGEPNCFGGLIGYKYGGAYISKDGEVLLDSVDTHPEASSNLLDSLLDYLEKKEK